MTTTTQPTRSRLLALCARVILLFEDEGRADACALRKWDDD